MPRATDLRSARSAIPLKIPSRRPERTDFERRELQFDGARFKLADIEKRVDQAGHRIHGQLLLIDYFASFVVADHAPKRTAKQAERLQRLAKIVAGSRQEAALGEVGTVGVAACFLQGLFH